jgi:hypothetical protein
MEIYAQLFGFALTEKSKTSKKLWISPKIVDKYGKSSRSKNSISDLHSPKKGSFFGIALTPISDLHSPHFGIALTEKAAQSVCHKAIQPFSKSIFKSN